MKLYTKLFEIQQMDLRAKRDWENEFFKNKWKSTKYATLDSVMNVLDPILLDKKILIFHKCRWWYLVTIAMNMEDVKESVESEFQLTNVDPQKQWSAITYAKRYNLSAIFNIMTEKDDDWNKASWKLDKKKYTKVQVEKLATWSETVTKWELMQKLAEIKKTYDTSDVDLLLSELANG